MGRSASHAEAEGTVAPNGDVVIPGSGLLSLGLVPGQHVRVQVVPPKARRNMRGVLAGKLPELTEEDFQTVRAEMWRGFPGTRAG
jgi:hypothetical protein